MRSGKPHGPWKSRRLRGVSVGRIAALVVLFAAVGAYGVWRLRPVPAVWEPVGAERIVTPVFDIADEIHRDGLRVLSRAWLNTYEGGWLGVTCAAAKSPHEVYVYTDDGRRYRPGLEGLPASRITATLDPGGGNIVIEEFETPGGVPTLIGKRRRVLDSPEAERFRRLLLDGGYLSLPPSGRWCSDSAIRTLESCVGGRYYGVVRGCSDYGNPGSFSELSEAIDTFARDGAVPFGLPKVKTAPRETVDIETPSE